MAKFQYSGKDNNNIVKKGLIDASSREEAALALEKNGISPFLISEEKKFQDSVKKALSFDHLSISDKMMFCEEIATLINSGVPLSQSIRIIHDQSEKGTMRKITDNLLKDIEGGSSLSGALEHQSKYFSPVFINMVRAGEAGGTLDKALTDLAVQTQKDAELISKIKGAMTYPAVIVVAMIAAVIFLMINVVPKISQLFTEMDLKLPLATRALVGTSEMILQYGIFLALGLIIFFAAIYYAFHQNARLRRLLHSVLLKAPVLGKITLKFNLARFCRTLGSLLGSGVSVLEALEIVSRSTQNTIFTEEVKTVATKVKNGSPISEPLKQSKIFPVIVAQMVGVGEETGNLDKMLIKCAEFYERQIENFTKNISSIIEPVIMLAMGLAIGFVVVSIITPIYQATSVMGS